MSATDLFRAGNLTQAIEAQSQAVRKLPGDAELRVFLFELLAFAGELDRAVRQLQAITFDDAMKQHAVQVYLQLIEAERKRRQVCAGAGTPQFLVPPPPHVALRLQSLASANRSNPAAATETIRRAEETTPTVAGTVNGTSYMSLTDSDAVLGTVLEVMAQGEYYWVPLEQVAALKVAAPKYPRDLLWAPTRLTLCEGQEGDVFVPALYVGSAAHPDDAIKLGRMTDWQRETDGPVRGIGAKLLLADEAEILLLECRDVATRSAPGSVSDRSTRMSESLFPFYERELIYLRKLVEEFAGAHRHMAQRLRLEPAASQDSHVESLLQTFALLTARIQQRLSDEFPEITDAFLGALYPHFLAPIPSFAVAQFELDPTRTMGYFLRPQSPLRTPALEGIPCHYRTVYPVSLWPIRLTAASFQQPPFSGFPLGAAPTGAAAVLRLQFECAGQAKFAELKDFSSLRLFLDGDEPVVALLYEHLFEHAMRVVYRPVEGGAGAPLLIRFPQECLTPVGFGPDEGLLPYPPSTAFGYRLLTDYFIFPAKFAFLDLGGWALLAPAGFKRTCEVAVFFDRTHRRLEQGIDATTFRLGCTPVVNLFQPEPLAVRTAPADHEYRLQPEEAYPLAYEVYSIDAVSSRDPMTSTTTEYEPISAIGPDRVGGSRPAYWYAARRPAVQPSDRGTEVALCLVDPGFRPRPPRDAILAVQITCMNRELPSQLAGRGTDLSFELEAAAPLAAIRCVRPATRPLRPQRSRGGAWQMISHLTLNHLSLTDSAEGLAALRDFLQIYQQFLASTPNAGAGTAPADPHFLEALVGLSHQRVIGRLEDKLGVRFVRGLEATLDFDEERLYGGAVYLFGAVLERLLAQYVTTNSFSKLVVRNRNREVLFRWPLRPGQLGTL